MKETLNNQKFAVIGLGNCGCNIVKQIKESGLDGIDWILYDKENHCSVVQQIRSFSTMILIAGMGGSGSTMTVEMADIAKQTSFADVNKNRMVVAIAVMPFAFEGKKRRQHAEADVCILREHVDKLIVLENDQLLKRYGDALAAEGFAIIDRAVREAIKSAASTV